MLILLFKICADILFALTIYAIGLLFINFDCKLIVSFRVRSEKTIIVECRPCGKMLRYKMSYKILSSVVLTV
jgi:hypothetical protein